MLSSVEPMAVISCLKIGVFRHFGVLLPNGLVAHCAPHCGEHISSVEQFACGHDVTIERLLPPEQQAGTLRRIHEAVLAPKAYDPIANNCETFVNRVLGAPAISPQLRATVALICLGAIAMARQ